MDDEKSSMLVMANRDRELLLPVADVPSVDHDIAASSSAAAASSSHHPGRELGLHIPSPEQESGLKWVASESNCTFDDDSIFYKELSSHNFSGPSFVSCGSLAVVGSRQTFYKVVRSWASKKFMTGCVILLPIAITFYITWWFIHFVDGFFSPIYTQLGIDIFGLGFVTSITFIFLVGVFMSSWLGTSVLSLGEWFIKRMPFVRHLYSASKQISAAISPDQNSQAFKEVAIIRHPRIGEYAIGFITSSLVLQNYSGEEELCCVYVPSNHLYIGDIFLVNSRDVIRPNLSVREGIEIVVSGGMSMPQILSTLDPRTVPVDRSRPDRS